MRNPHPANYTRTLHQLEDIAETAVRLANNLPDTWAAICRAVQGQPGAQNLDGDGSTSVLDEHGVPMPSLSDPTGEASTRPDPALQAIDRLRRTIRDAHRQLDQAVTEAGRWTPRHANLYEQEHTANGDPGCRSCSRLTVGQAARWEPVHHNVTLNGEKHPLCQWCARWVKHTGKLPDRKTLEDHHAGKRIRRPA